LAAIRPEFEVMKACWVLMPMASPVILPALPIVMILASIARPPAATDVMMPPRLLVMVSLSAAVFTATPFVPVACTRPEFVKLKEVIAPKMALALLPVDLMIPVLRLLMTALSPEAIA
jgi:hypothetical protein